MNAKRQIVIHFSGGSDSTLAAAFAAEEHDRVHLLTYDRISFIGAREYTALNYRNLCRIYGEEKFERRIVPIGDWHRRICYDRYFYFAKKYRLAVTALGFSKLAMHWYSCLYCLEHGVGAVADGVVPYMEVYPDQNPEIAVARLVRFYEKFGIRYLNPAAGVADRVEQILYDKGVTLSPRVRGTPADRQVTYAEQVVFALFAKYYLTRHGRERYVQVLARLFDEKIAGMERDIERRRGDAARLRISA